MTGGALPSGSKDGLFVLLCFSVLLIFVLQFSRMPSSSASSSRTKRSGVGAARAQGPRTPPSKRRKSVAGPARAQSPQAPPGAGTALAQSPQGTPPASLLSSPGFSIPSTPCMSGSSSSSSSAPPRSSSSSSSASNGQLELSTTGPTQSCPGGNSSCLPTESSDQYSEGVQAEGEGMETVLQSCVWPSTR